MIISCFCGGYFRPVVDIYQGTQGGAISVHSLTGAFLSVHPYTFFSNFFVGHGVMISLWMYSSFAVIIMIAFSANGVKVTISTLRRIINRYLLEIEE